MNALNLAENIIRLRHDKKITQEQLADFVGVTKASVSKWETKTEYAGYFVTSTACRIF